MVNRRHIVMRARDLGEFKLVNSLNHFQLGGLAPMHSGPRPSRSAIPTNSLRSRTSSSAEMFTFVPWVRLIDLALDTVLGLNLLAHYCSNPCCRLWREFQLMHDHDVI